MEIGAIPVPKGERPGAPRVSFCFPLPQTASPSTLSTCIDVANPALVVASMPACALLARVILRLTALRHPPFSQCRMLLTLHLNTSDRASLLLLSWLGVHEVDKRMMNIAV
jgi:hypothetical protein